MTSPSERPLRTALSLARRKRSSSMLTVVRINASGYRIMMHLARKRRPVGLGSDDRAGREHESGDADHGGDVGGDDLRHVAVDLRPQLGHLAA